jgi:hypothetical protein
MRPLRLIERIALFDHAIIEARERATHPDWREQYKQIISDRGDEGCRLKQPTLRSSSVQ